MEPDSISNQGMFHSIKEAASRLAVEPTAGGVHNAAEIEAGGNATGVNPLLPAMEGKRLGLLREVVPNAALIGVLLNPAMPNFDSQLSDVEAAARSVGQRLHILRPLLPRGV
jgi:ABC-type uncharacterized transport system substrate-binding protein